MTQLMRAIDRVSIACGIIAAGCILIAIVVVTYMVVIRWYGYSSFWEIEFSVQMLVTATFLGAPYTLQTKGHVAVDLLSNLLPDRSRRTLETVLSCIGLLICLYLAIVGAQMTHEAWLSGERSNSVWRPLTWPIHLMMPLGMGLTTLQYAVQIARLHRAGDAAP